MSEMDSPPAFRSQRQFCVDQMLPDEDPQPKNSWKFKKKSRRVKIGRKAFSHGRKSQKEFLFGGTVDSPRTQAQEVD